MEEILTEAWLSEDREAAIDKIMDQYGQEILQLAYSYVKNKAIAEDLTQEIFIKCYKNLHHFKRKSKLRTWVWQIAANHCKDYLRSWHNRTMMICDEKAKTGSSQKEEVEKQVIQKEEDKQLTEAVMGLPDPYREVIYLYYFEELTIKEISEVAEINKNTVKTRLKRAKDLLRESLEEL